jgi:hypothetical protein
MAMSRKKELENQNKKKKLEIVKRKELKPIILEKDNYSSSDSSEESNYSYISSENEN